jgi:transcriptional regulator with XRE-family HTH domain
MSKSPITPAQCRAARGLIGWNQGDLAREADVSRQTVNDYESGKREPMRNNLYGIFMALTEAGIKFCYDDEDGGRGVRFFLREGETRRPQTPTAAVLKEFRELVREDLKREDLKRR